LIKAMRTELLKIRTTRLPMGFLALAVGLTALVAGIESAGAGGASSMAIPSLSTAGGLRDVLASTGFALLVAAVFGATVSSGEFRHQTATDTYLDEPDRVRVLIAKSVVAAGVGLVFGLAAAATAIGIGLGFVVAKGYEVAVPGATIGRFAAGTIVASGLLAATGVGLGSLIRTQTAAIIAVFAWGFVVEQIVGGLFTSIAPYLPYTAAAMMAGVTSGGGMPQVPSEASPLPFGAAAGLLAGLSVVISALAARTSVRRDVS